MRTVVGTILLLRYTLWLKVTVYATKATKREVMEKVVSLQKTKAFTGTEKGIG